MGQAWVKQCAEWAELELPEVGCHLLHLLPAGHGPVCVRWPLAQDQPANFAQTLERPRLRHAVSLNVDRGGPWVTLGDLG